MCRPKPHPSLVHMCIEKGSASLWEYLYPALMLIEQRTTYNGKLKYQSTYSRLKIRSR